MALRSGLCRLLANPQRAVVISASRSQGTAVTPKWGKDYSLDYRQTCSILSQIWLCYLLYQLISKCNVSLSDFRS